MDILFIGDDKGQISNMKEQLDKLFKMKDLGCVDTFLGIRVEKNRERERGDGSSSIKVLIIENCWRSLGWKTARAVTYP